MCLLCDVGVVHVVCWGCSPCCVGSAVLRVCVGGSVLVACVCGADGVVCWWCSTFCLLVVQYLLYVPGGAVLIVSFLCIPDSLLPV